MTTRSKKTSRDDLKSIAEKLDKLTDMMDSNSKSTESSLQELVNYAKVRNFLKNNMRTLKTTSNKLMVR